MSRDIFRLAYDVKMQAGTNDTAEIMLYGEIIQDGPKWWKWSQEDKSAAEFDKALKEIREKGATKVLLRINSPGGICTESVAMRSALCNAGFEEIKIRIEGLCASAATNIATLPGAHVEIAAGSEYMIHNPWGGCVGSAEEMENYAKRLRNIESMSRGFYTTRTGQSEEQVKAWMDAETWFTAEDAVKYGFADEVSGKTGTGEELPAAACVSSRTMAAMKGLYQAVPEQIAVREEPKAPTEGETPAQTIVSDGTPVAGAPTEIHNNEEDNPGMEINELTAEQLQAQNPALFSQVQESAVAAERERLADIDALTLPGYEAMAAEAKAKGTSALDFQKQIVKAQKEKGNAFLAQRQQETQPAQEVAGSAATSGKSEAEELDAYAKDVAEYAKSYSGVRDGSMF